MSKALATACFIVAFATGCSGQPSTTNGLLPTSAVTSSVASHADTPSASSVSETGQLRSQATTSVLFSDTFEQDQVSGPAPAWTVASGSWAVCEPSGTTHEYCQRASASGMATPVASGQSSWSDYQVDADLMHGSSAGGVALLARMRDATHFYQFEIRASTQSQQQQIWYLWRYDGSWHELASGKFSDPLATFAHIRLVLSGSSISAYSGENNTYTLLGKASDSNYATGGIGLKTWGTTSSAFGNVSVTTSNSPGNPTPAPTAGPVAGDVVGGCQLFPSNDYWNIDISGAAVDPNSAAMIASAAKAINGGMSSVGESETIAVVPSNQPTATMGISGSSHVISDNPWPIGGGFSGPFQSGADGYLLVVQQAGGGKPCTAWVSGYTNHVNGNWSSYGGGTWDLSKAETPYPINCNSSSCGGTGISTSGMPGRLFNPRPEEFAAGEITHAVDGEFPVNAICGSAYVYPATSSAQGKLGQPCLEGGAKIRLKASFNESGYSGDALTWIHQLKHFGISVIDNGCCWGTYWDKPMGGDPDFNEGSVNAVNSNVRIGDFEVVSQ